MKVVQKINESRVFWLGVILCTVYNSYRYPLQINTATPTYSDTPFMLQAGKFLLACPLLVIAAVRCFRKTGSIRHWLIALGVLFLSSYALLKGVGDNNPKYLDLSFWMLFALISVWAIDEISVSTIDRYLRYLLIYALGTVLLQVVLFIVFGRLPALAFEGSYSIRFGGFLDDPNGFAAILFLLMGWSYARFRGWTRFLIIASIIVSMLLTQSWTALGFLIVVFLFWALAGIPKHPVLAIAMICTSALLVIFVIYPVAHSLRDIAEEVLTQKQGSIEGHGFPWAQWVGRWSGWAVLGDSMYNFYESWWASSLVNFGVPWFCAFVSLLAALIISLRNALSRASGEAKAIYLGLLLFGSYFVFGSLNLPFPIIFPINVIFFLFTFLVAFGKIRTEDDLTLVSNPVQVT